MGVRYVDPTKERGRLYLWLARFSVTPFGLWITKTFSWKLDPLLLKVTGGRLHTGLPIPVGLLETRGARSGARRRNATIYFHDGDRVTLVASNRGYPTHPSWFHNIRAHPDVTYNGSPFRAVVIDDDSDRARLTTLADRVYPPFAGYRADAAKAGRVIPVVQLLQR